MSNILVAARCAAAIGRPTLVEIRLLGVALVSLCIRAALVQELTYGFLLWNLAMAYVPLALCRLHHCRGAGWGLKSEFLLFVGWLLFMPYAPYLITDLVDPLRRLAGGAQEGAWLGFVVTATAAALGLYWFLRGLRYFDETLDARGCGLQARAVGCMSIVVLSALGTWMGRLMRLNTWDVLTRPAVAVGATVEMLASAAYLEAIAVTSLVLWVTWRVYTRYRWVGAYLR